MARKKTVKAARTYTIVETRAADPPRSNPGRKTLLRTGNAEETRKFDAIRNACEKTNTLVDFLNAHRHEAFTASQLENYTDVSRNQVRALLTLALNIRLRTSDGKTYYYAGGGDASVIMLRTVRSSRTKKKTTSRKSSRKKSVKNKQLLAPRRREQRSVDLG